MEESPTIWQIMPASHSEMVESLIPKIAALLAAQLKPIHDRLFGLETSVVKIEDFCKEVFCRAIHRS